MTRTPRFGWLSPAIGNRFSGHRPIVVDQDTGILPTALVAIPFGWRAALIALGVFGILFSLAIARLPVGDARSEPPVPLPPDPGQLPELPETVRTGDSSSAVRRAGFSRVHVFPYSPRPDTPDAGRDPVPAAVKAERSRVLRELSDRQGAAHRRRLRGSRQLVLVESDDGSGYAAEVPKITDCLNKSAALIPSCNLIQFIKHLLHFVLCV